MKILVTGSGGFVGKNLCVALRGHEVLAPRSSELDLTDYGAVERYLQKHSVRAVVHAAVHSALAVSREQGLQADLRMLVNLTRNLDHLDRLIVFGSGAEFAKTRDIKKVREDQWGEYMPDDAYGLSKVITQEIVKREPKMVNLRLFGVYGPYEDYRCKFISNAIVKNLLGLPIRIKQDVVFDYLYVADLIPVVEYFLTHKSNFSDYNVTTTKSIKLTEIVEIINQVAEKKSIVEVVNTDLNNEYTGNNARLRQEIPDWLVSSYETGISKLYSYYKEIIGTIDKKTIQDDDYYKKVISKST